MTRKTRIAFIAVLASLVVASWATAQPQDALVGTWQLNVAKSKYNPGPAPKSSTTTVTVSGGSYTFKVHQESATGAVQDWTFTTNLDGKPTKVTGNNQNADMISYKRIDANTTESIASKGGKETTHQRAQISADGKTRTVTTTGTDATGQKISNVSVFEKK